MMSLMSFLWVSTLKPSLFGSSEETPEKLSSKGYYASNSEVRVMSFRKGIYFSSPIWT